MAPPNGTVAVDVDNQPEVRFEIENRNAARGNDNVGKQTFPADSTGLWTVDVLTPQAQLLERLRFVVEG